MNMAVFTSHCFFMGMGMMTVQMAMFMLVHSRFMAMDMAVVFGHGKE
jgi:hypothetical protein